MSKPVLLSALALLCSIAALLLSLTSGGAPSETSAATSRGASEAPRATRQPDRSSTSAGSESDVGMRRRLAALEAEVAALRRRLGASPSTAALAADALSSSSSPEEQREAETALLDAIESDPEVREKLEDLVSEGLQKREERRWENRRARWEERAEERLADLAEDASLRPEQVTKLSAMLSAEREEMTALFQKAREEGGGWREMREQARELRGRTDDNASALLDEDQLPAYQAMREEERPGRRGRRRGGEDAQRRGGQER